MQPATLHRVTLLRAPPLPLSHLEHEPFLVRDLSVQVGVGCLDLGFRVYGLGFRV
jgi:hypothetical protein